MLIRLCKVRDRFGISSGKRGSWVIIDYGKANGTCAVAERLVGERLQNDQDSDYAPAGAETPKEEVHIERH